MHFKRFHRSLMVLFCVAASLANAGISEVLAKLPVGTAAERDEVCKELLKSGPSGIQELTKLLAGGSESKARHALNGLAIYASRSGGDDDRKLYVKAVGQALESDLSPDAKIFLIEQLRISGGEEAVEPLGKLLLDKTFCDPAVQVLLSLRSSSVAPAIRKALPESHGAVRATLAKALGSLRDKECAALLIKDAAGVDASVKSAALLALANVGEPSAADVVLKAANAEPGPERQVGTQACIRLAERLIENQNAELAAKLARELIKTHTDATEQHIQCAALYPLAKALGEGAFDDLLAAIKSDRYQFRAVARNLGATLPGNSVTRRWVEQLKSPQPEVRAGVLSILEDRQDKTAFPAAVEALKDSEKSVRIAAIAALALGQDEAVAPLVSVLEKGDTDEKTAARDVLAKLSGDATNSKIGAALAGASVPARKALLYVLGARDAKQATEAVLVAARDGDESVRIEALNALATLADVPQLGALLEILGKTTGSEQAAAEKALGAVCQRASDRAKALSPLLANVNSANASSRSAMLRVLRRAGGSESLEPFRKALQEQDADLQDVAARELSEWPDDSALADLLNLARNAKKDAHNVLAIRGFLRLAGASKERNVEDVFKLYSSALEVARRPDEKKLVIAAFGATKDAGALKLLDPFFNDPALKEEAATAYVVVARAVGRQNLELAEAALKKALAATENERLKKDAQEALVRLGK